MNLFCAKISRAEQFSQAHPVQAEVHKCSHGSQSGLPPASPLLCPQTLMAQSEQS